jgi:hypothetical protein
MYVKSLLLSSGLALSVFAHCQVGDPTNPGNWNLSYEFKGSSSGTDYLDDRNFGGRFIAPFTRDWLPTANPNVTSYSSWAPDHPSLEAQMGGGSYNKVAVDRGGNRRGCS